MASVTLIFQTIFFISMQIVVLTATETESLTSYTNAFDNSSLYKSGRSKRSLTDRMPVKLKLTMKFANDEEIHLSWMKYDQYLANEHSPVYIHYTNWKPNSIMKDIGEFVVYYDFEKCSAVVYFEKLNSFYGVIGTNYHIENLPFDFNGENIYREVVTEPYIVKNENSLLHINPDNVIPPPSDKDAWGEYVRPYNSGSNEGRKRPCDSDSGPSTGKRQRADHELIKGNEEKQKENVRRRISKTPKYYMETLVLVTHDIADIFIQKYGRNNYIEWIVRYHIIYFNAVNMFFKQITAYDELLYINIARIVIESDKSPFNIVNNGQVEFSRVVATLPEYLKNHPSGYPQDSFDYIFIHTAFPIRDEAVLVNSITKSGMDVYESRKANRFYEAMPISIVNLKTDYSNYIIAIHEIGRVLNMKIDPKEKGMTQAGQCYGIMQRSGPKCVHCLTWNDEYIVQFREFFSENRNRCFLINQPRSLRPDGPSKLITAHRQCACYGYDPHILPTPNFFVPYCTKPLTCRKMISDNLSFEDSSILPLDGTVCGHNKVCWNGRCAPSI